MKKHIQIFRHDPANGIYGDCHRTALACVFDMDSPTDVPHFAHDGPSAVDFWDRADAWLLEQGYRAVSIPWGCDTLQEVLSAMAVNALGVYWLLGGVSPRGTNHTVVCCGGRVEHDPHPDGGGVVGPCDGGYFWASMFVPARFWSGEE